MSKYTEYLRSLIRSQQDSRVRAIWRILIPVLVGFVALQVSGGAAQVYGLRAGRMMLVSFTGTLLATIGLVYVSARYLDHRPISAYGYRFSRAWWRDLMGGVLLGTTIVAIAFLIARFTGSLTVLEYTTNPDPATVGWFLVFLVAFAGVAFYEEFIYRGVFITNAVEGLTTKVQSHQRIALVAVVASSLCFALIHLPSAIAAGVAIELVFLKTALLGGLLGVAYVLTGELALPMGLHWSVNFALMNIFGIGAESIAHVPQLIAVESTATGALSPTHGIPILVGTVAGYGLVFGWIRWQRDEFRLRLAGVASAGEVNV